jgi:hypothetical protein
MRADKTSALYEDRKGLGAQTMAIFLSSSHKVVEGHQVFPCEKFSEEWSRLDMYPSLLPIVCQKHTRTGKKAGLANSAAA